MGRIAIEQGNAHLPEDLFLGPMQNKLPSYTEMDGSFHLMALAVPLIFYTSAGTFHLGLCGCTGRMRFAPLPFRQ